MGRVLIIFIITHLTMSNPDNGCNSNTKNGLLSYPLGEVIFDVSLLNTCKCDNGCIRKCCERNYVVKGKNCVFNDTDFEAALLDSGVLHVEYVKNITVLSGGGKCGNGEFYVLDSQEFVLHQNGRLEENGVPELLKYEEFCIDLYNEEIVALVCFPDETIQRGDVIKIVGMLVSVPFLLATFIIFAILPQRNLHGNALMCYVISLLGGFTLLAVLRLKKYGFSEVYCMSVVVPCIFFFLASFFWMNVMSIDIWWTFSGLGGFKGSRKESERKRFLIYSAYAWGVPLLLAILIISLSVSPYVPPDAWYNPGVGRGTACWFRQALQELIYFYGLLSFLTIANVILFAVTAYKIRQAQKDTAVLRKSDSQKHGSDADAQRFSLYLKLLLVMGLNWSMEIVSYAVDWQVGEVPPAVWYITDFCNALYGVLIFFLFCFNKKTWEQLKSRFKCGKPEVSRFSTQSTTAETRPLKK